MHLVSSTIFDVGVYLIVIGVVLDLTRSLGAGIDIQSEQDQAPVPQPESTRARPAADVSPTGSPTGPVGRAAP